MLQVGKDVEKYTLLPLNLQSTKVDIKIGIAIQMLQFKLCKHIYQK